nr:IS110 family transposase [Streptomyces sp. RPA4-2]
MRLLTEIKKFRPSFENIQMPRRSSAGPIRNQGLGTILGAEFLAATGGDTAVFGTPDRRAGFGGVAPIPCDSGKFSANLRHLVRYDRQLTGFSIPPRFALISAFCERSRHYAAVDTCEGARSCAASGGPGQTTQPSRSRLPPRPCPVGPPSDSRSYRLTPPAALTA